MKKRKQFRNLLDTTRKDKDYPHLENSDGSFYGPKRPTFSCAPFKATAYPPLHKPSNLKGIYYLDKGIFIGLYSFPFTCHLL